MTFNMRNISKYSCVVPVEEEQDDQGQEKQSSVNKFTQLLKKIMTQSINDTDIKEIPGIFESNKKLINYQHLKENKLRSILYIVKYSKLRFKVKQEIVNIIVDIGYKLFEFDENNCVEDNCHALFFTAAKCDYTKLERIVKYFKDPVRESKLHDTREGDTVLSFMIKFGDHAQKDFIKCFEFLAAQNIDFERIDYFKNSIEEVVNNETSYLKGIGNENIRDSLNKIKSIIREKKSDEGNHRPFHNKHELFRSVITNNKNFEKILAQNLHLKDSDDGENTLLQLAIITNNEEITKVLLQKGANPNHIVKTRNAEFPLVLAAKLNRKIIFDRILGNNSLEVSDTIFEKFVTEVTPKYLDSLLEYSNLNVEYRYKGKTPLYYAIIRNNKNGIQSLLKRGAKLTSSSLGNINPKDLEEYLNSCIKCDHFQVDMEGNDYKAFLVFDVFIKSTERPNLEIEIIREIGSNKRLEYLLEHPLIYTFILLKWYCVLRYYYSFVLLKFLFYIFIGCLLYTYCFNPYVLTLVVMVQLLIVYFNFSEFKFKYRQYTLHFILEISLLLLLLTIYILTLINKNALNIINQVSAFIIILNSLSLLLTLGYHISLAKWMAMTKRVFKNFFILLLFFILPILAFAVAFHLLLPFGNQENSESKENDDFSNLLRSVFRTFVMLSGDIGDNSFSLLGGYIIFLFFAVGMAIILLNFWTGVAVSDIKEIEEQSTVVAFNKVIEFVEGVEKTYQFLEGKVYKMLSTRWRDKIVHVLPPPFLKSKLKIVSSKTKSKKKKTSKVDYGIDLYINDENNFKTTEHFKSLRIENGIISKIKSLSDEKDLNVGKTLKVLVDKVNQIHDLHNKLGEIDNLRHKVNKIDDILKHIQMIEQQLQLKGTRNMS